MRARVRARGLALRGGAALAALLLPVGVGCGDGLVHVFGAYRYDAAGDCLENSAAIDVIDGKDPGTCAAVRCWISPASEVYVTSTACDAPPDYADHTEDLAGNPRDRLPRRLLPCGRALAAFERAGHGACPSAPDAGK